MPTSPTALPPIRAAARWRTRRTSCTRSRSAPTPGRPCCSPRCRRAQPRSPPPGSRPDTSPASSRSTPSAPSSWCRPWPSSCSAPASPSGTTCPAWYWSARPPRRCHPPSRQPWPPRSRTPPSPTRTPRPRRRRRRPRWSSTRTARRPLGGRRRGATCGSPAPRGHRCRRAPSAMSGCGAPPRRGRTTATMRAPGRSSGTAGCAWATWVSAFRSADSVSTVDGRRVGGRVLDYSTHYVPVPPVAAEPSPPDDASGAQGESVLDILVGRLTGLGVPAHQVWLPPLSEPPSLDDLLGPCTPDPVRGLSVGNPQLRGALQVPIALVDKPFEQRRDLLWLQLEGAAGHVAVVGGPQSGKSTLLRSLIAALALTHTPAEAQVYCLDFGGGQLASLRDLPHVGGVAGRLDTAAVRRTVSEIATLLADREQRFASLGVDTMATYRRRQVAAGASLDDQFGDVLLVIDGWATLRTEYDDLEPLITDLATRGLSYGIHVVGAASRWMDFRPAIRDLFGSRLELRLGDPNDSLVSRKAAMNVPDRTPGRGLTPESLHFLPAPLPLGTDAAGERVKAIAAAWAGPPAPRVRLLPATVPYSAIEADRDEANPLALPVGINEADLRPVRVDFAAEPHLLLLGDAECGKSTFLRSLAATIVGRFEPA